MKTIIKLFALFTLSSFIWACSKNDTQPAPDLSKGYPEKFANKVSEKNIEIMKNIGQKINEGQDPPKLSVTFKLEEYVAKSYDPKRVGVKVDGYVYYKFYNYNPIDKTCFIDWKEINNGKLISSGIGGGDFVASGHGNYFTSVGYSLVTSQDGTTKSVMDVYSGEVTTDGISDFQVGTFYLDKDGNIDPNIYEIHVGISTLADFPARKKSEEILQPSESSSVMPRNSKLLRTPIN